MKDQRTATYCAVITESGDLSLGLGDMDIHQQIKEQYVSLKYAVIQSHLATTNTGSNKDTRRLNPRHKTDEFVCSQVSHYEEQLSAASLLCADGNLPVSTINYLCSVGKKHSVPGIVTKSP